MLFQIDNLLETISKCNELTLFSFFRQYMVYSFRTRIWMHQSLMYVPSTTYIASTGQA